jgi:hypothetical protein
VSKCVSITVVSQPSDLAASSAPLIGTEQLSIDCPHDRMKTFLWAAGLGAVLGGPVKVPL